MTDSGEALEFAANLSKGAPGDIETARAGRLRVTSDGLEFGPRHVDRLTTAPFRVPVAEITAVAVEPASLRPSALISGGLRKRLRIERVDGSVVLFVVNRVEDKVERIRAILGLEPGG